MQKSFQSYYYKKLSNILNNRKFSESSLHSSASFREHFAYVSLQRTQKYSAISTCTAHFNHRPFQLVRLSHCVCLRTKKHTQKYSKPHSLDTNCLTRAQKPSLPSRLARCQKLPPLRLLCTFIFLHFPKLRKHSSNVSLSPANTPRPTEAPLRTLLSPF